MGTASRTPKAHTRTGNISTAPPKPATAANVPATRAAPVTIAGTISSDIHGTLQQSRCSLIERRTQQGLDTLEPASQLVPVRFDSFQLCERESLLAGLAAQ